MPRKTCTKQFKCEVVALYESTPRATVNAIAFDIGVNRTLLGTWLDVFGTDTKTIADGERENALPLKDSPMPNASGCWNARTPSSGKSERSCHQGGQIFRLKSSQLQSVPSFQQAPASFQGPLEATMAVTTWYLAENMRPSWPATTGVACR